MTILPNVNYFKELPFYNVSIDKPIIKRFNLLAELPFYNQLNIIRTDHAFSGYAMSMQLKASRSSIKDLFNDLLNET